MKRDNLIFLVCGFAFGILAGIGVFKALYDAPRLDGAGAVDELQGPAGPMAPTTAGAAPQGGAGAGAPMIAEIRALQARLQSDPADHPALVRLANLFHDAGMLERAIEYYERALEERPDSPNEMTDLGICYRGQGRFEQAVEQFQRANRLDPAHWQSLFNLAVVYGFDLRRFADAEAALDRLDALDPKPPQAAELRRALERARAGSGTGG